MKKLFTLLTMLVIGISGMRAGVVTSVRISTSSTKYYYTLECNSPSGHSSTRFISVSGSTINGQSSAGTYFEFENGAGDGQYYIKCVSSGKYLNPNGDNVELGSKPSGYWTITVNSSNVFLNANGNTKTRLNNNINNTNKLRIAELSGECSQWTLTEYSYIVPSSGNGYKLKMKGTDLYVKFRISGYSETNVVNATLLDPRGTIFKMESDGSEGYRFKWCNQYMKTTGSKSWNSGHGTDTSNATWYIEPVVGEDGTYYLKKGESGDVYFGNDQATPAVEQYLYTNQSTSTRNIKWILEEVSLLPETSTSSNPKYYTIENARGYCYAQYAGDNTNMALVSSRLASRANVFWFEAVAEDNLPTGVMAVKIHNAATDKCVASTSSFTNEGITWYLKANVYEGSASVAINSNSATWDNNSYGWNNQANGNTQIANWASTDIGSAWWIEPLSAADWDVVRDYSSELTANIQPFVNNPGNGYFQINSTNATSLSTMISEATSDSYVTLAEYTAIREQLYNNFMKYPINGGYYRIKNNGTGNYLAYGTPTLSGGSNRPAGLIATSNSTDAASVIYLTGSNGTYKISVQGLNIQQQRTANRAFPGTTDTGVDFTFNISSPGVVSITNEASRVDSNNDGSLHEASDGWGVHGVVNWDASAANSKWVVEDATSFSGTLTNANDNTGTGHSYATLCVPFAISSITGASAYVPTKDGNYLVMGDALESTIEAGTPVMLVGATDAGSYTAYIKIDVAPVSSPEDNALTGTFTGTSIDCTALTGTNYVLGFDRDNDNRIGFYHVNSSSYSLKANRAYLNLTGGDARGFTLMFDDVVTGIVAPIGETEEGSVIHNLSGQRLNKMQKGINIVNGKKVLF